MGYSPWGRKESDTTERIVLFFKLVFRHLQWDELIVYDILDYISCGALKVKSLSRVRLSATPWTVAYQASPSMGFSRQEY